MKKLLLHVCCGPCSAPIIPKLDKQFEMIVFYYNPNIFPAAEFNVRLESARKIADFNGIKLIVPDSDKGQSLGKNDEFLEFIGETKKKPERCLLCYRQRLAGTAQYAKANNFDCFSTTLLISPFQYHEGLKNIGEEVGQHYGVHFSYQDFRPLYKESRELAEELDLYLQKYCGCKFSRKRK